MAKIFIVFFLIIQTTVLCFSQVQIVDSQNNSPVPFVHLISGDGKLLGTSNINGVLDSTVCKMFIADSNSVITFHHVSYNNLQIESKLLSQKDSIFLNVRDVLLPEVNVTRKGNEPQYVAIKGYYRSYQLDNNIPKYFTDGIVVYYISLKKNILKNRVLEHRSFRNEELINSEKKRKVSITIAAAGIPYIESKTIIDNLDHSYSTVKELGENYAIFKEEDKVGMVEFDSLKKIFKVSIDLIAPEKEKVKKLFNYTSTMLKTEITEDYSSASFSSISKGDLLSRKEYRKMLFKHDKEKESDEIDVIHEFYVLEKEFLFKSDLKNVEISDHFGLLQSTKYSDEYWENVTKNGVPELSVNIRKLLGKDLTPYN